MTERPRTAICTAVRLASEGTAPDWLHLLPAGELVHASDGRGPYRVTNAAALIAASLPRGSKLPLCENHATDLAAPQGGAAPARGWIVELQQRADGIWGKVEWTGEGRRIVEDRQYRGVSPVIAHRKDGAITALLRASLTNVPNLVGLKSLHQQGNPMDSTVRQIVNLLGIPIDSGDAVILDKLKFFLGEWRKEMQGEKSQGDPRKIAMHATAYQAKMARDGITISLPAAVRAVADGTAKL